MQITLPPCPCPICGNIHPSWMYTSAHSVHGAGRGSISKPTEQFKLNMTAEDLKSSIYGPLWASLIPDLRACRPVEAQHADSIFYRNRGFGQTDDPTITTVAPTDGTLAGWVILGALVFLVFKKTF